MLAIKIKLKKYIISFIASHRRLKLTCWISQQQYNQHHTC